MTIEEDRIGEWGEVLVTNLLNSDKRFAESFAKCLREKLGISLSEVARAERVRGERKKCDIRIYDVSGSAIGLSLKTRRPGRPDDHLDRRWLGRNAKHRPCWKDLLKMPDEIYEAFKRGLARKALNPRSDFIALQDREMVKNFLSNNLEKILKYLFVGDEEDLKLFGVLEYDACVKLTVFKMDDVIEFIKTNVQEAGISFGGNIKLGEFLWIQRKGGDRKGLPMHKTDPRHPGNQIQAKVLPLPLRDKAKQKLDHCEFMLSR